MFVIPVVAADVLMLLVDISIVFVAVFMNVTVRHIQHQMRNIGLMVIKMISPQTEKQKTQKPVVPVVIMALGQRPAVRNLLKMVRVQMVVSQQQLASAQAVHGKAH